MTSLVTIWPHATPVGWTGELTRLGEYVGSPDKEGRFRYARSFEPYPLRVALSARYTTDAHFVPYVMCFDGEPGPTPRCNASANDAIAGLGGKLLFGCLTLDCDDREVHGTPEPARDEWRRDWWRRVASIPLPTMAYETRGGGRVICELAQPLTVESYFAALSGLHAFGSDAGLLPDRLIDAQRCYRLPFVTRDGKQQDRRAQLDAPALTFEQQTALIRCGEQNPLVVPREVRPAPAPKTYEPGARVRPGEYLAQFVSWAQILEPDGGRYGGMMGSQEIWYRPGKKSTFNGPPSALTNYQGNGRLKVLTSNWPGFDAGASVDKLGAIMAIEGCDAREAARIAGKRFGMPERMSA